MNDIIFFNWSNQPWQGRPDTAWQIPGMAYSASTHCVLGDSISRPKRLVFQNTAGQRGAKTGETAVQLYAYSGDESVKASDPHNCASFTVLAEAMIKTANGVSHSWRELKKAEIDKLMALKFRYGLVFGVRHRSVDGVASPVWYSSKLLVLA